jgi:hypothetical protein
MANKMALVVGLEVAGWQKDVSRMSKFLKDRGFPVKGFTESDATPSNVLGEIDQAAELLQEPNDFFVFYFSGHGASRSDSSSDEDDGRDELLCLANNSAIVDDDLWKRWLKFNQKVRVALLTDSCHSGTVGRALPGGRATWSPKPQARSAPADLPPPRFPSMGLRTEKESPDPIADDKPRMRGDASRAPGIDVRGKVAASMVHMSGCRDKEESFGSSTSGGKFTSAFLAAAAEANYDKCHEKIRGILAPSGRQDSQLTYYGGYIKKFRSQAVLDLNATL